MKETGVEINAATVVRGFEQGFGFRCRAAMPPICTAGPGGAGTDGTVPPEDGEYGFRTEEA